MAISKSTEKKLIKYLKLVDEYEDLKDNMAKIAKEKDEIVDYIEKHVKREFRETDEIIVELKRKTVKILKYEKKTVKWKSVYNKLYDKVNEKMQKTMGGMKKANTTINDYVKISEVIESSNLAEGSIFNKFWDKVKNATKWLAESLKGIRDSAKLLIEVLPE